MPIFEFEYFIFSLIDLKSYYFFIFDWILE